MAKAISKIPINPKLMLRAIIKRPSIFLIHNLSSTNLKQKGCLFETASIENNKNPLLHLFTKTDSSIRENGIVSQHFFYTN